MNDRFQRTAMLMGESSLDRLSNVRVAVFGVGGVGGYAVEVLARSGVGHIDLVDNDTVDITNINRQIVALTSTIGLPKVEVARDRIKDINPDCVVRTHQMFYLPETAEQICLNDYDYVVDCIDTITAKINLALRCHEAGVPIISSMGAANKLDATAFRVADISQTSMDPIAKIMRKKLRRMGMEHLKVVFSTEQPIRQATDGGDNGNNDSATVATSEGETAPRTARPLPASNAFVPAAAGIVIGGEVVKDLTMTDEATETPD